MYINKICIIKKYLNVLKRCYNIRYSLNNHEELMYMQKIQKTKIKKIIELLNSPLIKDGVHLLICDENEVLVEYNGKVYTQDTIIVK